MKLTRFAVLFLLAPLLAVAIRPAHAADRAKVLDIYGVAQKRVGSPRAPLRRLNSGDLLPPGSYIKTGSKAAVLLQFSGRHVLRVGARTTVELRQVGAGRAFSFKVFGGQVWSKVQSAARPARYEVATPSAVVGVSGTLFSVFYDRASTRTRVSTDEGVVRVRQGKYNARVAQGFVASLRRGRIEGLNKAKPTSDVTQVWRLLRGRESWMQSGGKLRLDRRVGRSITQRLAPVRSSLRISSPRSQARSTPRVLLRRGRAPRSGRKIRDAGWGREVAKGNRGLNNAKRNEQKRERDEQKRDEQKHDEREHDEQKRSRQKSDNRKSDAWQRDEHKRDEQKQKSAGRSTRKRDDGFLKSALPALRGDTRRSDGDLREQSRPRGGSLGGARGDERDGATRGKRKGGDGDNRQDESKERGDKRGKKEKD